MQTEQTIVQHDRSHNRQNAVLAVTLAYTAAPRRQITANHRYAETAFYLHDSRTTRKQSVIRLLGSLCDIQIEQRCTPTSWQSDQPTEREANKREVS